VELLGPVGLMEGTLLRRTIHYLFVRHLLELELFAAAPKLESRLYVWFKFTFTDGWVVLTHEARRELERSTFSKTLESCRAFVKEDREKSLIRTISGAQVFLEAFRVGEFNETTESAFNHDEKYNSTTRIFSSIFLAS
jgi:hypothetical protein